MIPALRRCESIQSRAGGLSMLWRYMIATEYEQPDGWRCGSQICEQIDG
jgi:hypothetical protein